MANSALRLVAPTNEMRTARAGRKPNAKLRTREYLTEAEVEWLIKAASGNRYGHRNATYSQPGAKSFKPRSIAPEQVR